MKDDIEQLKRWPAQGELYVVRLNGVWQHDIYEFDQGDDGFGGGEHFWSREDIDECPVFDPDNDEWISINEVASLKDDLQKTSAALQVAQERAARAEERLKLLSEALYRVSDKLSACPPDCLGTGRSTEVNVPPWSIRDEVIHDIKNSIIDAIKVQS